MQNNNELDGPEPEVPEGWIDPNPERGFADAARLGFILKITDRQVRNLAAAGVLPRQVSEPLAGHWEILPSIDRWIQYKSAPPSPKAERLAAAQVRLIDRRIAREDLDLIETVEATDTIDEITGAFQIALDVIETQVAATDPDPNHVQHVVRPVFCRTRASLADKFGEHRAALIAGPKKKGARL